MTAHITLTEPETSDSFIKFPKILLKNSRYKNLSCEAKLLYAMLIDRMSLSKLNGWYDDEGQIYIYYSLSAIAEDLGCCKDTAGNLLTELENTSLIRKQRQGLGKPNKIYFEEVSEETELRCTENPNSSIRKNRIQETEKVDSNKTEYNKTELNKTDINNTYSEDVCDVMEYLNEKTGKNYRLNAKNKAYIEDRFREGYEKKDFIHVIDVKYKEWHDTDKEKYIRPSTLFKEENFDNYVNQRDRVSNVKRFAAGKTRLEDEHDYDVAMLERALFGG